MVVLVVEDEALLRDMVVSYLQDSGCTVLEAATGEGAVAWLNTREPIDVVFTDIRLGGRLNGWDVGEMFRARRDGIPVIYTSGHSVEPPRHVPGSVFFDKPYKPSDVFDACHRLANGEDGAVRSGHH